MNIVSLFWSILEKRMEHKVKIGALICIKEMWWSSCDWAVMEDSCQFIQVAYFHILCGQIRSNQGNLWPHYSITCDSFNTSISLPATSSLDQPSVHTAASDLETYYQWISPLFWIEILRILPWLSILIGI